MRAAAADGQSAERADRLGWPRTVATGIALLFAAFGVWGFCLNFIQAAGVDFISFWAAGKLTLAGHPAAAYDINLHRQVEAAIVPNVGLIPFPYPPPFLMLVTPFALLPFGWALVAWTVASCAFYALCARRFAPVPYALANPPSLVDWLIGQTGFLTAGLFLLGLGLLPTAPFAAGAVLGLLLIKPQLALLLPVAMLAGRQWRAIAGAVVSSMLTLAAGLVLFGSDSYRGFVEILPHYVGFMRHNSWNWVELASPFAFLRFVGVGAAAALAIHAAIAVAAAAITLIAWWKDWEENAAILAAATLLISPYVLTYDALLLVIPAGLLIARKQWWELTSIWLLCALPVLHFYGLYEGPNTIPIAAILSIALVRAPHRRHRIQDRPANAPA